MRAGGGKDKGSRYERDVCKDLSLWVSGGTKEDLFWRSAMSGGRATIARRRTTARVAAQAGDITATAPEGHILTDLYYIEVKRYADLNFGSFLTKGVGTLAKFWQTAISEASHHGKVPMLIVREDLNVPILIVPHEAMLARGKTGHVFNLNPEAMLARMMKLRADVYLFEEVLKRPFVAPSAYNIDMSGPMLKPGELQHILQGTPMPVDQKAVLAAMPGVTSVNSKGKQIRKRRPEPAKQERKRR